jgi:hypothetical protein
MSQADTEKDERVHVVSSWSVYFFTSYRTPNKINQDVLVEVAMAYFKLLSRDLH